ncbi:hypothetical protein O181_107286 [Austropuccinia psidii MF-1]|uniref:Uncharacterized protein n=1 Tax=Austropuccinia psidii MF-1 TaxID=1389203 RepID=A0A9Q3JSK1_9BASI|nr:hypothetical protein [Austropuccinia psidii MF-1]
MECQQAVQDPGKKGVSRHFQSHRRTSEPDRDYSYPFRLTRSKPARLHSSFISFRHQKISDKESPFFTIPGNSQEKKRIKREKHDFFQPETERVRTNDPEAVGLGERNTQEPEIAINTFNRIRSHDNSNITPTQNKHSFLHLIVT